MNDMIVMPNVCHAEDSNDVMVFDLRVKEKFRGRPETVLASIQTYLSLTNPDFHSYIVELDSLSEGLARIIGPNPYTIKLDAYELMDLVGEWQGIKYSTYGSTIYYRLPTGEERSALDKALEITFQNSSVVQ